MSANDQERPTLRAMPRPADRTARLGARGSSAARAAGEPAPIFRARADDSGKIGSVLILLPPSESKTAPAAGPPISVDERPELLREPTQAALDALVDLCTQQPSRARTLLKLTASQEHLVARNAALKAAATAPAWQVYTGVLYDALDFPSLTGTPRRRGLSDVMVASTLFGLVGLAERIPAYRLSAGSGVLPGVPGYRELWSQPLASYLRALDPPLIVDLRSAAYVSMWPIPADMADRTVTVKIWQASPGGERTAVSHHNKAYKGRVVRSLLSAPRLPRTRRSLLTALARDGWTVGMDGSRLDVVVEP